VHRLWITLDLLAVPSHRYPRVCWPCGWAARPGSGLQSGGFARRQRCRARAQSLPIARGDPAQPGLTTSRWWRERWGSDRQTLASLGAAGIDHSPAAACFHADEEAVGAGAANFGGLVGAFHEEVLGRHGRPWPASVMRGNLEWGMPAFGLAQRLRACGARPRGRVAGKTRRTAGNPVLHQKHPYPSMTYTGRAGAWGALTRGLKLWITTSSPVLATYNSLPPRPSFPQHDRQPLATLLRPARRRVA